MLDKQFLSPYLAILGELEKNIKEALSGESGNFSLSGSQMNETIFASTNRILLRIILEMDISKNNLPDFCEQLEKLGKKMRYIYPQWTKRFNEVVDELKKR